MTGNIDAQWQLLMRLLQDRLGKSTVGTEAILLLIGLQETGLLDIPFGKDEKYNLIHVGMCTILAPAGYYHKTHTDAEGWPHYTLQKPLPAMNVFEQAAFMRQHILAYFSLVWPQLATE